MNIINEEELDIVIELYFFDASRTKEEYIDSYKKSLPDRHEKEKGYRYSNLFLLRKEIRQTLLFFGKDFNKAKINEINKKSKQKIFDENYFAEIVILNIALINLIKKFYGSKIKDFLDFLKKYMQIDKENYAYAFRYLRNGLEHYNYSLYYYVRKRDIEKGDKYHKAGEKIYFRLGLFGELISKRKNWKRPYVSSMYQINPRKLYSTFEKAIEKFKVDLLNRNNIELRKKFRRTIDVDNWIRIT